MRRKTPLRIALLMGQDLGYCRRVLSGVLSYAESGRLNWSFHNAPPEPRILEALQCWKPDGIIVHLTDYGLRDRLLELNVPVISVTNTIPGQGIPFIDVDSRAVGRVAADYFLGLGFRTFAYYGNRKLEFSRERGEGFRERLESLGYSVEHLHADFLPQLPYSEDWSLMDREASRWLKHLPKPVAILASNDIPARVLCETCRLTGIRVPDEVCVLGVDNDVSECRMSYPPLSSVELPAELIGRESAMLLRRMMAGEKIGEWIGGFPPSGVISRSSTDNRATGNERLKRVMNYIDRNADQGITVAAISEQSGFSRRSLERCFREELGCTILEHLQKVRVARAKRLLLETELSIAEVAERSGLSNLRQLNRVFRQYEGETPSDYRMRR